MKHCLDAGKEESSDWESSDTLEMWRQQQQQVGGTQHKGAFLPALPLLSCGRGQGKDCCSDPPTSQLTDCQGQGREQ